jgi:hypothetical protein
MAIGIMVGYGAILLEVWWPIAVTLGFATFASATLLIERHIRNGAERRALRDYENARRRK